MTRCYIVTEGESDRALLERVFRTELRAGVVEIVTSRGGTAALSTARTLVAVRKAPVALVIDADTTDERRIEERRDYLAEALRAASPGTSWKIFLAVPELEAVLFDDPSVIEWTLGVHVTDAHRQLAKFQPKHVLEGLFLQKHIRTRIDFVNRMPETAVQSLRESTLIKEIREFLEQSTVQAA